MSVLRGVLTVSAIRRLIEGAQPGTRGGIAQHVVRGEVMRRLVEVRYGISRPEQWRAKHVRWVLERALAERSASTRYAYYRTARVIAAVLGRWPDWEPHLRGPWNHPSGARVSGRSPGAGGRPPKLPHRGHHTSTSKV
jgi:hypothetical protein